MSAINSEPRVRRLSGVQLLVYLGGMSSAFDRGRNQTKHYPEPMSDNQRPRAWLR
jgi:hypothetical protein